jgi:GDPmannose 4,6-dehydratase|tara:strand:+ start:164 stop:1216 length:1053 start_codon:yes stop_codon:yes gene_type:complete
VKKAIIYGVTGQDGSYLSDLLLSKQYTVYGVTRRSSSDNTSRITHSLNKNNFNLVQGDVTDTSSIYRLLNETQADEVYNLAAQSNVGISFGQPQLTWNVTGQGCLNILEVIRSMGNRPRFYQASSSEMFGDQLSTQENVSLNGLQPTQKPYQNEQTRFNPQSPYGVAKLAAHHSVRLYRESYGIFACGGILFNHESERRGEKFVTRKISRYVANLHLATQRGRSIPKLKLGNLCAIRDWGHAEDYVGAMWLMLQQDVAEDYVIATGNAYSVEDYLKEAFKCIDISEYMDYVEIDKELKRPSEVPYLRGSALKAKRELGWIPKIDFKSLVSRMVQNDIQSNSKHKKDYTTT